MKKLLMAVLALSLSCSIAFAEGKTAKEIRKERQEIRKMSKKELNTKVDKSIRKEAKRLSKEGWQVNPGSLPLEKQLERSYLMQYEFDENLLPKYIMGEATSVGENLEAARISAQALAINDLARQIQIEVTALIENTVSNRRLTPEEAASISESVMNSKTLISQSIGRTIPVIECFRLNEKKNTEVLFRVAYNSELALEAAKKAVRAELEQKGANLNEQLEKVLGN